MDIGDPSGSSLLENAQNEIFLRLIPVIVVMAAFGAIGLLGNILTITFYVGNVKRSPSSVQITCLAVADLVVCMMIVPNILEMVFNVNNNHVFLCKFTHFMGFWGVATSCLILWIIALDRHRKICKPFVKQITITNTKHIIIAETMISFLLGIRNLVNFEPIEVKLSPPGTNVTVIGRYCTTRGDGGYKLSASIFHSIDILLVITCWITIIVTYSLITYTLVKLKNKNNVPAQPVRAPAVSQSDAELSEMSTDTADSVSKSNATSTTIHQQRNRLGKMISSSNDVSNIQKNVSFADAAAVVCINSGSNPDVSQWESNTLRKLFTTNKPIKKKRRRRRKIAARSTRERSLTFMMMIVSLIFVLCLLPYCILRIVMRFDRKLGLEFEAGVGTQFGLRLAYLNSVFNPMVYCLFNPQFRKYVKQVLLTCCRRKSKVMDELEQG